MPAPSTPKPSPPCSKAKPPKDFPCSATWYTLKSGELARQTGLGEKTLHRMLNRDGNPTARNLGMIVKSIAADLGIRPRVEVAACR